MSKFATTGTTRGGYRYGITHENPDGSKVGWVKNKFLYKAVEWVPNGKSLDGYGGYDLNPPNEAAELLGRLQTEYELSCGRVSVCIRLFNDITAYLKRQAKKPE